MLTRRSLIVATITIFLSSLAAAEDKSIVVASTTSTEDSGLFSYLLPIFKQQTGIHVRVAFVSQRVHRCMGEKDRRLLFDCVRRGTAGDEAGIRLRIISAWHSRDRVLRL